VNLNLRWAAAAAVLVVAILAGTRLLAPAPNSGASAPSPSPSSSPSPSAAAGPVVVHATGFAVPLTLTLVDGWTKDPIQPTNLDLQRGNTDLGFHPLSRVTLPPPGDPDAVAWIPVPADFVAWVKGRPEFVVGDPRPVTVGGRSGTLIDGEFVWKTGTTERDFLRYGDGAWRYDHLDAGARVRFIIVPGPSDDGVIIVMNAKDADFDAAANALDALLATVQFDAPAPSPSS
jgi:hypothetical protein